MQSPRPATQSFSPLCWKSNVLGITASLQAIMVLVPALRRWWQLSPVKDSTDSLSYYPLPEARIMSCSGSFQQCKQLPLCESHNCPCFNNIANYTRKFRVQLIVVLWSRCSSGKKNKLICKHSDALLSTGLFIFGEE